MPPSGSVTRPLLIVNPYASGVTPTRVEAAAEALGDVEVRWTERPGHATDLAHEAPGRDVFVFSGDGGFNEALNGVGEGSRLGLIPGGGAKVLARALGLPRDPLAAARQLVAAAERRISVGRVNGRRFGFAAGVGFD